MSRANSGLAGNILIGGGIGALIDHSNGSRPTHIPPGVRLVFGEFAVLDRSQEREGTVLEATPGTATAVTASTANTARAIPVHAAAAAPAPAVIWKPVKGSSLD